MVSGDGKPIGCNHVIDVLPGLRAFGLIHVEKGVLGLIHVEKGVPLGIRKRCYLVMGAIAPDEQLFALAFDVKREVARCMPIGLDRTNAGNHITTRL